MSEGPKRAAISRNNGERVRLIHKETGDEVYVVLRGNRAVLEVIFSEKWIVDRGDKSNVH